MMMIIEIKWKCIAGAKKENYNIIFFHIVNRTDRIIITVIWRHERTQEVYKFIIR